MMSSWWRTVNGHHFPKSRFTPNGVVWNKREIGLKWILTPNHSNRTSLLSLVQGSLRKKSPPSGWTRHSWMKGQRNSREQSVRGKSRTKRWTPWDSRCVCVCLTSMSCYNHKSHLAAQFFHPLLIVGEKSTSERDHTEKFEACRTGSSVSIDCRTINHYWLLVNMWFIHKESTIW